MRNLRYNYDNPTLPENFDLTGLKAVVTYAKNTNKQTDTKRGQEAVSTKSLTVTGCEVRSAGDNKIF